MRPPTNLFLNEKLASYPPSTAFILYKILQDASDISALFFAFHIAFTGFLSTKSEPIKLNVIQMGFTSVYSLIALVIFSNTEKIQILKGMSLVSLLYISIFATAVSFFLQTYCQKNTTSTTSSSARSFFVSQRRSTITCIPAALLLAYRRNPPSPANYPRLP